MAREAHARTGDRIVFGGHWPGDPRRIGTILRVLGPRGRERYRVRWDDGQTETLYDTLDAIVERVTSRMASRSRRREQPATRNLRERPRSRTRLTRRT